MRSTLLVLGLAVAAVTTLPAADATAGKAAYDKSCKSCHGADGTPNPAIAKAMKVDMKDFKSADVQGESEAQIAMVITMGKGKMRPVASAAAAAADIAAYIHTMK
jgi:mono/diheme cytochrome c family protein